MQADGFGLPELIAPVGERSFFSEYWEKKPLTIHRNRPAFYASLFSIDAVDGILSSTDLRLPAFRLVKHGAELPPFDYTKDLPWGGSAFEGVVDVEKVLQHYREGATIVLQALHRNWQPISKFCRRLEKRFTQSVQANAYLTPKRSQGFSPHYDTHDVFVLQVSGRKRWRLYNSPIPLPHETQKFDSELSQVGDCESEFDLEAGDLIYIPRGFIHEGLTTEIHSLHLTIAIPALTWVDVLSETIKSCVSQPEFRKSLPIGFAEQSEIPEEIIREFKQSLQRFVLSLDVKSAFESVVEKYIGHSELDRLGSLASEEITFGVDGGTRFARRADVVRRIVIRNDRLYLMFGGKKVELPSFCAPAIDYIESISSAFCANDLPGELDLDGRVVLLRRLFQEGYLCRAI